MKELIKPQKVEKEKNEAQVYCEGGNQGMWNCTSKVSGDVTDCPEVGTSCSGWSAIENNNELLF